MGLGDSKASNPENRKPNFKEITPLYIKTKIAAIYLHKPPSYFDTLSFDDRIKLICFEEMERAIEAERIKSMSPKKKIDKGNSINRYGRNNRRN